jgi:hypothetical protein
MSKPLSISTLVFWPALTLSYIAAWINGFRMPNLWSINYFIPSIFEGFYRRSLLGTATFFLGNFRFQYHAIAAIQFAVFIALNIVIIRACIKRGDQFKWFWVWFLLSPAGGYLFHEVGYVDQLLYLLLFASVTSSSKFLAAIVMLASLWIHEMALFTTIPLYIGYLLLQHRPWKEVFTITAASLICFGILYFFFQTTAPENLSQFLNAAAQLADHSIRQDYYTVFSDKFIGQRFQWYYSINEIKDIALIVPLWVVAAYGFSKSENSLFSKIIFFMSGLIISLCPLILGTFGWDVHRWIFLSMASTLCCIYWVSSQLTTRLSWAVVILFVLFSFFGKLEYFDGYTPRLSDWTATVKFIKEEFPGIIFIIPQR